MLILIVLIVGIVGYYAYLSNKTAKQTESLEVSKAQTVLLRDLELNYPPTVKEVIKYFGEIILCLYGEECEESDIDKLASKLIFLYDEKLLENNPWGEYLPRLKQELADMKKDKIQVTGYAPAGSASVDFFTQDGYEWARIYCSFYIKKNKVSQTINEIFLLRKDDNGLWKIYGWDLAENVKLETEE